MDLLTLLIQLTEDGGLQQIVNNPLAQFGRRARRYIGAELLPEKNVETNAFTEEAIRYRTVLANAGTRYSPSQLKGADIIGSFHVVLGHSDIARQFDGRQYDALLRHLCTNKNMEAITALTNWLDTAVNLALIEFLEKERWDAMIDASVVRNGDNNFQETVAYSDPTNHRVTPAAAWSLDTTDIFEDIHTQADLLASKGYEVSRIITGRTVLAIMAGNDTVKTRTGIAVVDSSGQITSASGRATHAAINGILKQDGLPPIELYNQQYRTSTGTDYFLDRGAMLLVATSGRDEEIDLGDDEPLFLQDTLGYTAIGLAAGQNEAGRVIQATPKKDKPPRIEAEGWQTGLPVITEPEAIAVIKDIS